MTLLSAHDELTWKCPWNLGRTPCHAILVQMERAKKNSQHKAEARSVAKALAYPDAENVDFTPHRAEFVLEIPFAETTAKRPRPARTAKLAVRWTDEAWRI